MTITFCAGKKMNHIAEEHLIRSGGNKRSGKVQLMSRRYYQLIYGFLVIFLRLFPLSELLL